MKKRLISLLLVTCMVFGFTSCGSKKKAISYEVSTEPVTIRYFYDNGGGGVQQYTKQVEEKLNEILKGIKGYEHITIELVPSSSNERDLNLAFASNAQVDLVSTWGLNINTMCKNGDFIELDDLMKQFPGVTEEMPDWIVNYGKVFGKQYYIPTYQQIANLPFVVMPQEYFNMYLDSTGEKEADVQKKLTNGTVDEKLDFLEKLCLAVREKTGSANKWIFPEEIWSSASNVVSGYFFNQEYIGNQQFGNWILRQGEDKPEYFGYTSDFKKIVAKYAEWYQKGLIHPDCTSTAPSKFTASNFLNDSSYVNYYVKDFATSDIEEKILDNLYGIPMKAIRMTNDIYVPSEWEACGHAISSTSEHPPEAMMIIELLRNKKGKEFYNTLVYGLEGIHWEWKDQKNDKITTLEFDSSQGGSASCTYSNYKWSTGNVFNAWKNQSYIDGYNEYILDMIKNNEKCVMSPAMGITWDFSNVENQFIQVTSVEGEYKRTIYTADDWQKRYDEYIAKLESAGIKDVLKELDRQLKEVKK